MISRQQQISNFQGTVSMSFRGQLDITEEQLSERIDRFGEVLGTPKDIRDRVQDKLMFLYDIKPKFRNRG